MSITKIRSMYEHKGCQVLLYVIGFLTCVGLLYTGTCMLPWTQQGNATAQSVPVEVAGVPVSAEQVEQIEARSKSSQPASTDPQFQFYTLAGALEQGMRQAATLALAKEKGVQVNEQVVTSVFNKQFSQTLEAERLNLIQQGKLKPNATDADFLAEFKKNSGGRTPEQIREANLQQVLASLDHPERGPEIKTAVLTAALGEWYEKKYTPSLDDLKKSFDNFSLRRLPFDDQKKSLDENAAAAEKALAEIRGGGSFEAAVAKYGKGKVTVAMPYNRQYLETNDALKFVLDLKPGAVTDVIREGNNAVIYKLVSVKNDLPPDFDKNKDMLLRQFQERKAMNQENLDIEKLLKEKTVWKSEAYRLAYDVFASGRQGNLKSKAEMTSIMKDLAGKLALAQAPDNLGMRLRALGRYVASETYFASLTPAEQKEEVDSRAEALRDVLQSGVENMSVRLQLYDLYLAAGDTNGAGEALVEAAASNAGTDPAAIMANGEIESRIGAAAKAGKVSKQHIADARREVARWKQERIAEEKEKAEVTKGSTSVDEELKKLEEPDAAPKSPAPKK